MTQKIDILLIEDNENDAHLFKRVIKKEQLATSHEWLKDGEEVIENLVKEKKWLPKVILLDLMLPKVNGFEVLAQIRADSLLANVPVVILSSSNQIQDIKRAYHLGANSFLTKPDSYKDFKEQLKTLSTFWLKYNKNDLP